MSLVDLLPKSLQNLNGWQCELVRTANDWKPTALTEVERQMNRD